MTPARFLGFIAIAIVWLNITNLYTLISGLTGIPFKAIGLFFMFILFLYLVVNNQVLGILFRRPQVWYFLIVFIAVPIVSMALAPVIIPRFAGYLALSALMFLTVMVWINQEGWENFCKVLLVSWITGITGIILSYLAPSVFESVAYMQKAVFQGNISQYIGIQVSTEAQGRAFGFYMQANRACLYVCLHLVLLLPTFLHNKPTWRMLLLGTTFFAVLLTGSRGGFIYMLVLCAALFYFEMRNGVRVRGQVQSGISLLPRYIILGILAALALILAESLRVSSNPEQSAAKRIISSFFDDDVQLSEDNSVLSRLIMQRIYLSSILKSPVIGYGLGASDYKQALGELNLSSHNNILETAYAYGIPMTLAMYGFFIYLCFTRQSKDMQRYFRYNMSWIIVACIFIASFLNNSVFDYRVFPTVMAFWLSMLYFPKSSHQPAFIR